MNSDKNSFSSGSARIDGRIEELLHEAGIDENISRFKEMIITIIKYARENSDLGDVKLLQKALKELRHASRVFNKYANTRKVAVFGSARTKEDSVYYQMAKELGGLLMESHYMVITGGGDGIMGAAQEGAGRERGFALNISLPFEQAPNKTILGDDKLITFKYFFTRKLHFIKNSSAIVVFPGGFGTMDEAFEVLTLIQTGKSQVMPVVFVEHPEYPYWKRFFDFIRESLLSNGYISENDLSIIKVAHTPLETVEYINRYYHNFHSLRYVKNDLIIRLNREIDGQVLDALREKYQPMLKPPFLIEKSPPQEEELNEQSLYDLPRLKLTYNRKDYGRLVEFISECNQY